MDVRDAGKRGGECTRMKHGKSFYKQIGEKGGHVTAERYKEDLSRWGKKGGRPRKITLAQIEEDREKNEK